VGFEGLPFIRVDMGLRKYLMGNGFVFLDIYLGGRRDGI
jgi:hypothetical protein